MQTVFFKIAKITGIILLIIVLSAVALIALLTITEFRPKDIQPADLFIKKHVTTQLEQNATINLLSWNVGYCALGKEQDFFADGGTHVRRTQKHL